MADILQAELDQHLTFTLGDELFALGISSVREILDDKNITRIPRTPEFMRGVINLRGHAVPVVDLRLKFGMSKTQLGVNTCIIITEVKSGGEIVELGALADSVQEVVDLAPDQIGPPPRMGAVVDVAFIKGIAHLGEQFLIVLDVDRVFSSTDLADVVAVGVEAPPVAQAGAVRAHA
jgi:purine-binding chemotaxis protein CheW